MTLAEDVIKIAEKVTGKHQIIDQTGNPHGKEGQGKVVGEFDSHGEAETFLTKFEKDNPNSYCEIKYKK